MSLVEGTELGREPQEGLPGISGGEAEQKARFLCQARPPFEACIDGLWSA